MSSNKTVVRTVIMEVSDDFDLHETLCKALLEGDVDAVKTMVESTADITLLAERRLKKMELFHTPESVEELTNYVAALSNGSERMVAMTVMGMTWNLAADLVT